MSSSKTYLQSLSAPSCSKGVALSSHAPRVLSEFHLLHCNFLFILSLFFQSFVMHLFYPLEQNVYQRVWGRGFEVRLIVIPKETPRYVRFLLTLGHYA